MLDQQSNLITVASKHNAGESEWIDGNNHIPMPVSPYIAGEATGVRTDHILYRALIPRRTRGVQQILQKLKLSGIHANDFL
jgi:hypothetical protein